MFNWLRRLSSKNAPLERAEVLNAGLNLAMEWGEQWLQPIQQRLAKRYTGLSVEELDRYNAECQAAMKFGHDLVYLMAERLGADVNMDAWRGQVLERYSWINESNLSRLFSQGMYYAYKDGVGR